MNNDILQKSAYQVGAFVLVCFVFITLSLDHTAYTTQICFAKTALASDDTWKQEFNDVCSKTTDSMSLSREELKTLIARCEKLKPVIEEQEESTRKVYRKRLEMCKNLFVFVLESKK